MLPPHIPIIKNIGINEHIEEIFTNFNKKQDHSTITSSDDSIKNNDLNDATLILSNKSNQQSLPLSLNNEDTDQMQTKILTKKKPLFKKNSNVTSSSSENSSDSNDKLTIKNTNYLIVVDTPTKSDDASENISAINQTLSKSANRMELVDSRFYLQNSPRLSMLNNTSNQSPAINLSKRLNEDSIVENESETTNKIEETKIDEATIFKEPIVQNYSYIMDSMNSTNVLTNFNNSKETFNKLPPAASDLLGISCMADSLSMTNNTTNTTIRSILTNENVNKNVEQDPKPSDKETQLLTDSELSVIDTISKQNNSSTSHYLEKSVSSNKNNDLKNKKIEFVCSLLKPDMKVSNIYLCLILI